MQGACETQADHTEIADKLRWDKRRGQTFAADTRPQGRYMYLPSSIRSGCQLAPLRIPMTSSIKKPFHAEELIRQGEKQHSAQRFTHAGEAPSQASRTVSFGVRRQAARTGRTRGMVRGPRANLRHQYAWTTKHARHQCGSEGPKSCLSPCKKKRDVCDFGQTAVFTTPSST